MGYVPRSLAEDAWTPPSVPRRLYGAQKHTRGQKAVLKSELRSCPCKLASLPVHPSATRWDGGDRLHPGRHQEDPWAHGRATAVARFAKQNPRRCRAGCCLFCLKCCCSDPKGFAGGSEPRLRYSRDQSVVKHSQPDLTALVLANRRRFLGTTQCTTL